METQTEKSTSSGTQPKTKNISKKSRLIVRNLSFQVTEEKFRKYFGSCGDIQDVNILKKANGKLVGCAFIQYAKVPQAAKALRELNLKPFMGRPIAIDWALPKEKFQDKPKHAKEPNVQPEIKEEGEDELTETDVKVKEELVDEDRCLDTDEGKEVLQNLKQSLKRDRDEDDDSDSESDDSASIASQEDSNKRRKVQNMEDADEGKTLFIRNLEFETTQEKLKEFFEFFGPLCYTVLCKDRLTEHPKGTAFVKFQRQSDMEVCVSKFESDPSYFVMGRRNFIIAEALSKNKLDDRLKNAIQAKKEPKDNRNLFLAREGFIRPETEAASGLSLNDVNTRTILHRAKRQMLKNLHVFVSDVRICIHNLPPTFTDKNLRKLFLKYGGKGVHLTEAKVMRDLNNLDIDGIGKSKEFGFVTFTKHENALQALRAVNNNPSIFTPKRRPIVEFSLENRKALLAKQKRAEKSREKNKNSSTLISNDDGSKTDTKKRNKKKMSAVAGVKVDGSRAVIKKLHSKHESHEGLPNYSGLTAKAGVSTLPSLKAKGKITRKSLKPAKHQKKRNQPERRMREPKSRPQVKTPRTDQVDKLVTSYKQRTMGEQKQTSVPTKKQKKKWFN